MQCAAYAKGRVERNHGTHQDRLVKKLRRKGIAEIGAANAFLETAYWADHNRRFARPSASTDDFHVAIPRGVRLDAVFRLAEKRVVSNDWVVRYDNRYLQVERQSHRPPARATVQVYETVDGHLEIRYRDRVMRWQEIPPESLTATRAPAPSTWQAPPTPAAPLPPRARRRRSGPSADHPWQHAVDQYETAKQLAAARRAWRAVQP